MPELPEVHTTITGLQKKIIGLTIKDLWSNSFSLAYINRNTHKNKAYFKTLKEVVTGNKIMNVSRRGKHILIHLSFGDTLVVHLKMTGHLLFGNYTLQNEKQNEWPWIPQEKNTPLSDPFNRHIRVVFTLIDDKEKESHLVFCDSRKFGTMELFSKDTLINKLGVLGPEPLEKSFTLQNFTDIVKKKRSGVTKSVLMDQKTIVGVGNIYSDEALHLARINPLREVTSLSDTEIHNLYTSIREVLSSGIDFGGDSMSDYRNVDGARGAFQRKHKVYLRKGKECLTDDCHGTIQKKVIGGRSAHFCSTCQK